MFGKQKSIQPLLQHIVERYLCKAIRNEAAILSCFVNKNTFLQETWEIQFVDNGLSFHQKNYVKSKRMRFYHIIWKLKDISIQLYTEEVTEHKNPSLVCGAKNKSIAHSI